jgi:hypothetical protein
MEIFTAAVIAIHYVGHLPQPIENDHHEISETPIAHTQINTILRVYIKSQLDF